MILAYPLLWANIVLCSVSCHISAADDLNAMDIHLHRIYSFPLMRPAHGGETHLLSVVVMWQLRAAATPNIYLLNASKNVDKKPGGLTRLKIKAARHKIKSYLAFPAHKAPPQRKLR